MGALLLTCGGPVRAVFEVVEHFAGFGDIEDAFSLAVLEIFRADTGGVAITEVDFPAGGFGDASGEGDLDATIFDAVLEATDAAHMGRMGQDAPRVMGEAVPLLEEVIPAVVADFFDEGAVGDGDFMNMGGVDDELAAICDDRLEFIHAFATDPKLVIHEGGAGEDRVEGARFADDMKFLGEVAGLIPGLFG